MIINNNISALNANRQLNLTGSSMTKTIAQLSSGQRIELTLLETMLLD